MTETYSTMPKIDAARRIFEARYSTAENGTWQDNPLIEALPRILTYDQFMSAVCFLPPYNAGMRKDPKELRLNYIHRALQFFIPMEQNVLLQQRLARIIRDGYVARNPLVDLGWSRLHQQLDNLTDALKYGIAPHEPPSSLGFAIIGIGGVGKTTGVNAVMRMYPRVIVHRSYIDSLGQTHQLARTQIVFLKLNCPEDGGLKSLCLSFFRGVDHLTGFTNYYQEYGFRGTRQRTATDMLPDMARVAALHSIGVLIIDEIQFLSKQKSGGREQMLQWFTRLTNEINLPVVLVGTPRAKEILDSALWQRRRNAGQGEFYWERMEQDEEWDEFLRALWRYEFVQNPTDLTAGRYAPQDLNDALYRETQGIADLAVKMFMVAQERAINSGYERLTPGIIETVAKDDFGAVREIIQAIRTNDPKMLATVDDVPLNLKQYKTGGKIVAGGTVMPPNPTPATASETLSASPSIDATLAPVLPALVRVALARSESGAQALRAEGYARLPTEFGM